MQQPNDQISTAPVRPLFAPVMTKIRQFFQCVTLWRHIHWCPSHAIQIGACRSGHSGFGLALFREDLGSAKVGKFDVANAIQ